MPYRHTQRGTLITFLCLVLAAVDAAIAWRTGQWSPVAVLIILVAVAVIFSSLTVEVNGEELRWHLDGCRSRPLGVQPRLQST